jgi:hypothetical protein
MPAIARENRDTTIRDVEQLGTFAALPAYPMPSGFAATWRWVSSRAFKVF